MDAQHFDKLARKLASRSSRRQLLRGLLGGAAAGLFATREAEAACREAGRRCTQHGHCCSGICDPGTMVCVCPLGQENCRGACVDPATAYLNDVLNCGACGNRCPVDQCNQATCGNGVCGLTPNPARIGQSCDDGNCCTENDVCQNPGSGLAVCTGSLVVCDPPAACQEPGTCSTASCQCEYPLKSDETVCQPVAGECDVAESCDGINPDCPPDEFKPSTAECRAVAGECDVAETCPGDGPSCPPNGYRPFNFSCGAGPSCGEGIQHAQDTCDGRGACTIGADTSCGLYVCGAIACLTSCGGDSDCVPSAHCDDGVCLSDLANGQACNEHSDCQSGICDDTSDICCDESCDAGVPCTGPGFTCCIDTTTVCTTADCGKTITDSCGLPIVCPDCERTFGFTGGNQDWIVPSGVSTATFDAYGAQGSSSANGRAGGLGGRATATFAVTVAQYRIVVGGAGGFGAGANGGFNGAGAGTGSLTRGGGGGGASDVRTGAGLADRILVAGGGGGGGVTGNGGTGGGTTGGAGTGDFIGGGPGGGGTQSAGGAGGTAVSNPPGSARLGSPGVLGVGGAAGSPALGGGGGGGGGYYGGGGGGCPSLTQIGGGGGGGSGFVHASGANGALTNGVRSGNGQVLIRYRFD